jgi:surfeit locus 1 family protein
MSRRLLLPLVFGIVGTVVLLALGTWQLQRASWKSGIIAQIEARLEAQPVAVPPAALPAEHQYLRVYEEGELLPEEVHVYTSFPPHGVGYRVIAPFETREGRRLLLDRGFIPIDEKAAARRAGPMAVQGTLHWPQETDRFTSDPDREANIWFARDTSRMADALRTEPVMIVADYADLLADVEQEPYPLAMPVTVNIPNNHLEYVVTWYGLAFVWAGMTVYWIWRARRPDHDVPDGVEERA